MMRTNHDELAQITPYKAGPQTITLHDIECKDGAWAVPHVVRICQAINALRSPLKTFLCDGINRSLCAQPGGQISKYFGVASSVFWTKP